RTAAHRALHACPTRRSSDLEDRAEELLAEFDAKLEEGRRAVEEAGLAGEPFVMADGWLSGGTVSIRMYTPGSFFGAIGEELGMVDRKSTRLNSSHVKISYAV